MLLVSNLAHTHTFPALIQYALSKRCKTDLAPQVSKCQTVSCCLFGWSPSVIVLHAGLVLFHTFVFIISVMHFSCSAEQVTRRESFVHSSTGTGQHYHNVLPA